MTTIIGKTIEFMIGLVLVIFGLIVMAIFNILPYLIAIWVIVWALRNHIFF